MKAIFLALLLAGGSASAAAQGAPNDQVFFGIRPAEGATGAAVADVAPGGTAAALGVQSGDVVIWMNGADVVSTDDMIQRIRALRVGETVVVRVRRGGRTIELSGVAQAGTPVLRPRRVG